MSIKFVKRCIGKECGSYNNCLTKNDYWVGCELRSKDDFPKLESQKNLKEFAING